MKNIYFNDFSAEPEKLKIETLQAINKVINSGDYILGEQVSHFEHSWAEYINVRSVVGVGNAFDGLVLGMQALGIGPGDEVITTPMTAYATTLSILRLGAKPIVCDIDPLTAHLCLKSALKKVNSKTKALLYVHLYGRAGNLKEIKSFCSSHKIYLVEDCAQAHGAKHDGVTVGSVGEFGAWSFYPTKNLGAIGDAGAVSTNNLDLAEKISMLRNYGQSVRYYHDYVGINSRLDELQAAILNIRLAYLNEFTEIRRRIAKAYNENISSNFIQKMKLEVDANSHVYHLYVLKSKQREKVMQYLKDKKIPTLIHYPVLTNLQKASNGLVEIDTKELKNAMEHAETCFSIPCHPQMDFQQVDYITSVINDFK
jgi:dTDP-4-amino-4,6-dideoxygalactose transaminase